MVHALQEASPGARTCELCGVRSEGRRAVVRESEAPEG